jgi:uncharacterized protein (TIGR03000 family)
MYSIVLAMALSNGATIPAIDARERFDVGSYATHGHTVNRGCRCSGGCYGGCYGCWGGCYGGCHGGWGCHSRGRCHGGWGCHGCWGYGCYGSYGYGCHGSYGYGCHGCHGYGSYGYGGYVYGDYSPNGAYGSLATNPDIEAAATIVVNLPADARLIVNDQTTTSTSDRRMFRSPPLKPGEEYSYTFKAEINRDGKPITATKQVSVRAGRQTEVQFEF